MVCSGIKEEHIHTEHHDLSNRSSCGVKLHSKIVLVCTHGFGHIPDAKDVIDMMLLRCKQEVQTAFNRHAPLFTQVQFRPMGLCLNHNPPASIGYGGFLRGRSDLNIGASR